MAQDTQTVLKKLYEQRAELCDQVTQWILLAITKLAVPQFVKLAICCAVTRCWCSRTKELSNSLNRSRHTKTDLPKSAGVYH